MNISIILLYYCERFEPRSHFKSRLGLIVRVNVVLNRTAVVYSPIQDNSYIIIHNVIIQDYVHLHNQTQPTFKIIIILLLFLTNNSKRSKRFSVNMINLLQNSHYFFCCSLFAEQLKILQQ